MMSKWVGMAVFHHNFIYKNRTLAGSGPWAGISRRMLYRHDTGNRSCFAGQGGKGLRIRGLGRKGIYLPLHICLYYLNLKNNHITLLTKSRLTKERA